MDKLIINSKFMKGIIVKIIKHFVKKSFDVDPLIDLKYFNASVNDDYVVVKLDTEIKISKEDFLKIVTKEL